jgi:DNA polymerase I-like protein with 3'-5' exonuclease and polymerase domains
MRNSCVYKPAGTDTFRLSSTKLFDRWGSNLQNVEKSVRKIYVPDSGMIFVQVDQSGAEALIVAYCGKAGKYRTLFENGVKPHTYMALNLFTDVWPRKMMEHRLISSMDEFDIQEIVNCPIPELKSHPHWKNLSNLIKDSDDWALTERYYYLAKQTEHSSNYDIQPPTFRMNILDKSGGKIVISQEDAERFLGVKHALFPEIKQSYHRYVQKCVEDSRCLYNLHGHPITISDYDITEKDLKEHYARIPQSTVGEITNIAFTRMFIYIQEHNKKWDLLANTHDSYMLQCPIEEGKDCATVAQEFMQQEFSSPIDGVKFSMKSEAQIGFNWAPAKASNPNGLKTI